MKKIKLFALCFISFGLIFTACKDDDSDKNKEKGYAVNINVVDGAGYDIDSVRAVLWADIGEEERINLVLTSALYENGNFTITLPGTIDSKYLSSVSYLSDVYEGLDITLNISDPSAMMLNGYVYFAAYKNGKQIGYINYMEKTSYFGDMITTYVYLDRPVNVTGQVEMESYGVILKVNSSYVKGWNTDRTKASMTSTEIIMEFVANDVQGLNWYFVELSEGENNAPKPERIILKK